MPGFPRSVPEKRGSRMNIEVMTEQNSGEVLAMMRVFYASPAVSTNGSEEIFRADLARCLGGDADLEGYMLIEDGATAGYAMVSRSFSTEFGKPCIWIEDLYLKPEYREKGFGTQFLRFLTARCPDAILRLEVEAENRCAVHTYRKNGFSELPYLEMKK